MRRSGTPSRATSAAAPATRTSSLPSARPPPRCGPAPPPRPERPEEDVPMTADIIGAPLKRREDARFITGKGRYLDDIQMPGMAYLAILRSPYAHARIRSIDTAAAKAMLGVVAVYTGADIPYNPPPMAWPAGGSAGLQNNVNSPRALATDDVKWTGEGVAAVVADSPEQAQDAPGHNVGDWGPPPGRVRPRA